MKIILPGGSGQVGTILARHFRARGDDVVILSRRASAGVPWRAVPWDARTLGPWAAELDGADVVINLAGRSVNCRYNPSNRREIMDSRVESTRVVGEAIARAARTPRIWLQASTATIYAHRFDAPNDDVSGIIGGKEPGAPDTWRFSIDVATSWERALEHPQTPRTRKVALRSAMTMSPDRAGIFDTLLTLARRGLGGPAAGGRQFVSWVHDRDFCRAVDWLIARSDLSGPINISSPNPVPYREFMLAIRRAWGGGLARIGLPAPRWMIEIGTRLMRTESELVLKSRRVVPRRLLESGFAFDTPNWQEAATDLCRRRRQIGSRANSHSPA